MPTIKKKEEKSTSAQTMLGLGVSGLSSFGAHFSCCTATRLLVTTSLHRLRKRWWKMPFPWTVLQTPSSVTELE